MISPTKKISIKYNNFQEWVKNVTIITKRVDTNDKEGDLFTKTLPKEQCQYLIEKFMGWCCLLTTYPEGTDQFQLKREFISGW